MTVGKRAYARNAWVTNGHHTQILHMGKRHNTIGLAILLAKRMRKGCESLAPHVDFLVVSEDYLESCHILSHKVQLIVFLG